MKIQLRDTGLLGIGFIIGVVLALLLANKRAQPAATIHVPSNSSPQLQRQVEDENTGNSITASNLKQRAVRKILEIDLSKSRGCTETRNIKTKPVSFTQPGVLTERWEVQRCGTTVFYNVQFIPNLQGEMEVAISAE
jgi:hypothetical protein